MEFHVLILMHRNAGSLPASTSILFHSLLKTVFLHVAAAIILARVQIKKGF